MTNAEEDDKQQKRLERRLDKASGWGLEGCFLIGIGCLPVLALILLPFPLLLVS